MVNTQTVVSVLEQLLNALVDLIVSILRSILGFLDD